MNVLAMVAEDHVPITVEILLARSSAPVALGTAWVAMDALAMVSLDALSLTISSIV
jgi:hypothetical protein